MNILRLAFASSELSPRLEKELQKSVDLQSTEAVERVEVDKSLLQKELTPLQYQVTQQKRTETAYTGKYVKFTEEGEYECVVCKQKLFRSESKFNAHCGWPAFTSPVEKKAVCLKRDTSDGVRRVEAQCSRCGSHLGHLFDDGPLPTRLRYCVNSAALNFVERESAAAEASDSQPSQSTSQPADSS